MIRITFVLPNRQQREVEVEPGLSLMEAAVRNNVPGITGDCGGACSCGTCLVHVHTGCLPMVGPPGEYEAALLDFSAHPSPHARLACQITASEVVDGLIVEIP
ncbi:2Fe-2S iron-sulfur cluster-binding protein [Burkholderia cepacia]|uniref:2Fe-2S iron-sulfur cluster-binding protein n=1 Tax=Burkholderia cepacia TaxID=292 RepID=UPI0007600E02|nr:2Fe-2S iron-sulfur cluster-binding protein [Burkholderia cepacia]